MKALGFGAIVWDDIRKDDFRADSVEKESEPQNIGGAVFNVMAHLAKLGCESMMVSSIGTDKLGDSTMRAVANTGVHTDMLQRVDKPTCLIPVEFDQNGQPSYIIPEDVSFDYIEVSSAEIQSAREMDFDCFLFGTIEQRNEISRSGLHSLLEKCRFRRVLLDVNLRPPFYSPEVVAYSLHHCSVVKMSIEEADEINAMLQIGPKETEPFCSAIRERFAIEQIVVTAGDEGAYHFDDEGFGHCPGYKVTVSDPVGAGDAFVAGLAHRLGSGGSLKSACDFGNRLGALIASKTSSIPEYDLAELDELKTANINTCN